MSAHKIVAGIDEAHGARDAAALAAAIGDALAADVVLVAAYQDPLLPFPPTFGNDHRLDEARSRLAAVRPRWAPHARTEVVPDVSAARALQRVARDEPAALLVLGPSSDAPAGGARVGRIGRQVLHAAPCPVAVAAAGLHEDGALRSIVVGLDETPESEVALAFALELAAAAGARLTAVAVAEDVLPVSPTPWTMLVEVARWDDILAARRVALDQRLETVLADHPEVARELRTGDPTEELCAAAADADLLVVGSRRWGPRDVVSLGTTAEALSVASPCSLVVMPRAR